MQIMLRRRWQGMGARWVPVFLTALALAVAASCSAAWGAEQPGALSEALRIALAAPGWVELPRQLVEVRYSGPTLAVAPGMPPGPVWYGTTGVTGNSRPHVDERQEQAFVRSVEAARAGKTQVIEGGQVLLVDPAKRVWAVAAHTPHLLRCYDGRRWTYRRADGLDAAADEPAAFARLAAEGKLPRPDYAKDGLRDRNDLGRWYAPACADAAGNLHFIAACVSKDAEDRNAGGAGVHTLRPDGSWSFFRIYPANMPRSSMQLDNLRIILHTPPAGADAPAGADTGPAAAAPAGDARKAQGREAKVEAKPAADLLTIADFMFSDPVAESHGQKVIPIPGPPDDRLRQQGWKDHTDVPRFGPRYLLRFDGRSWRFDRTSVGWGSYDAVSRTWPQPDGRVYIPNRFGLWVQWPAQQDKARLDRLVGDALDADEQKQSLAADTLVSMGAVAAPVLREAVEQASTDRSRTRLTELNEQAERVARGEEDAVPVVAGRWRFLKVVAEATMADGRFEFFCQRALDVRAGREVLDCLVFFDPVTDTFEVRPIDRAQWNAAGFGDKREMESPRASLIDRDGGL